MRLAVRIGPAVAVPLAIAACGSSTNSTTTITKTATTGPGNVNQQPSKSVNGQRTFSAPGMAIHFHYPAGFHPVVLAPSGRTAGSNAKATHSAVALGEYDLLIVSRYPNLRYPVTAANVTAVKSQFDTVISQVLGHHVSGRVGRAGGLPAIFWPREPVPGLPVSATRDDRQRVRREGRIRDAVPGDAAAPRCGRGRVPGDDRHPHDPERTMSVEDPVIITCAISGAIANREQCPAIPYTPEEYGAEARRIVDEGGVHIHIHARRPDGTPSYEVEDFVAIRDAIREAVGDAVIINFSTGTVGVPVQKRIAYLEAGRPAVAALNMGSMNYAKYSRSRKDFVFKFVFTNPFDEIVELLEAMRRLQIKPEHECFDVGHVGSLAPLVDMGLLEPPLHADFVMGVVGGIPASARNLAVMADNLAQVPDAGRRHHWGVIGIGREQWMLVAAALTLGGSIRVGLEDNFYLPDGRMARSNGELIAKARQMTEDAGRRAATVDEARALLGIGAAARA